MKVALIGAAGQLGTDLKPLLGANCLALGSQDVNITDAQSIAAALDGYVPDLIINAAAYNLVDRAEDEPDVAYAVNALGPRNLALYCREYDAALVHVSSDYVFGLDRERSNPFCETDVPGPLSAYAVSKLAGEYYVQSLCDRHFVVRTCGLYGQAARQGRGKGNFIETMLRLGSERDELRIVNDQHCTPTASADVARAIAELIQTDAFGLCHATNEGQTSWYELACEVFRLAKINVHTIPISTAEFGAKAQRPAYSVLCNEKLTATIGHPLPDWQNAVAQYLRDRRE